MKSITQRAHPVESPNEQAALQPWVEMECYQLGHGKHVAQVETLDMGKQQIVRESQLIAIHKLGATPANLCTVSSCTENPTFRFSKHSTVSRNTVFFMPERNEFDIYVPNGAQTTYISFNQDEFLAKARILNPQDWECAPTEVIAIPTPQRLSFIEVVAPFLALANAPGTRPELINTTLQDALLQSVLHMTVAANVSLLNPSKIERTRALQVCNQARDFVSAQFATGTVPTIVDVCSALGVSERTLQYAFRAYVDMSPLAYLRMCRLNSVRNALQASHRSADNVTAVAMRFGFLHLGRFALDYKRAFGESPSHTLASSVSGNG